MLIYISFIILVLVLLFLLFIYAYYDRLNSIARINQIYVNRANTEINGLIKADNCTLTQIFIESPILQMK